MVWTHSERRSVPTHHDVGSLKIRGKGTSIHGQFNGDSHLAPTSTRAPRRALRARCSLPAVACPLFFRPLGAPRLALCALRLLPAVLISPSRTTVSLDPNMLKLATSPLSITSQPMKVAGAPASVAEVRGGVVLHAGGPAGDAGGAEEEPHGREVRGCHLCSRDVP